VGGIGGVPLALLRDEARSSLWLVTSTALVQVHASAEDRYVWQVYLQRATSAGDDTLFESAITFCKTPGQRVTGMHPYTYIYIHTCMHTIIFTYIHIYIHTYINAYIHTYT
ncbi:hypothetical protein B484DRAFT_52023, partial [Ochromonadaceae sp. CCMP2298]